MGSKKKRLRRVPELKRRLNQINTEWREWKKGKRGKEWQVDDKRNAPGNTFGVTSLTKTPPRARRMVHNTLFGEVHQL